MCSPPKRIFPECPFTSNQKRAQFSILTPRCAVWLRSVMHTTEITSAVRCTPLILIPWYDIHCGDHLRGVMHIPRRLSPWSDAYSAEIISVEWCINRGDCLRGVMHIPRRFWNQLAFGSYRQGTIFKYCTTISDHLSSIIIPKLKQNNQKDKLLSNFLSYEDFCMKSLHLLVWGNKVWGSNFSNDELHEINVFDLRGDRVRCSN